VLDAGQLRLGYVDQDNPGALLGATRGGSVFAVDSGVREMPADGAKGPVKGDERISKVVATLTVNMLEMSSWVIRLSNPGSTETAEPNHVLIRRWLAFALRDYRSTIALIAEVKGTDETVVCILENVIGTNGIKITTTENDEAVLQIVFQANFSPAYMDTEPWIIRNASLLQADFDYEVLV
jgi:hypothetical protein